MDAVPRTISKWIQIISTIIINADKWPGLWLCFISRVYIVIFGKFSSDEQRLFENVEINYKKLCYLTGKNKYITSHHDFQDNGR